MRLPKFEYRKPATIEEASVILSNEPGSRVLAGGTDLLVNMKHRVETPGVLVNIKGVAKLDFIRRENGAARIGALTRLKKPLSNPPCSRRELQPLPRPPPTWGPIITRSWEPLAGISASKTGASISISPRCGARPRQRVSRQAERSAMWSTRKRFVTPATVGILPLPCWSWMPIFCFQGWRVQREIPLETFFSG